MKEKENIPQDIDPIMVSTKILASIEDVWMAITQPQSMEQWFYKVDIDQITDGSAFSLEHDYNGSSAHVDCLVLELEEPSKLRYTWSYPNLSQGGSTVNWDLVSEKDLTEVIITHEGIHHLADAKPEFDRDYFINFWTEMLDKNLRSFLNK